MNYRVFIDAIFLSFNDKFTQYLIAGVFCIIAPIANAATASNPWTITVTPQAYFQSYDGTTTRDNSFNVGAYVTGNYLESNTFAAGFNSTLVNLDNSASVRESLIYVSGRHHLFLDALPGKLTLRLDYYNGSSTLEYRVNNPPTGMKKKIIPGTSSTERQSTSISVIQPMVSFINYSKTFYLDLGYARSDYSRNPDATVNQVTPTVGFGWNESYDWLQLRAYVINLDESNGVYNKDNYNSQEITYTHWFADGTSPRLDFARIAVLNGDRVLAVDPDAAVVHSTGDKQTGGVAVSAQWKISENNRVFALVSRNKYENDIAADKYTGLLFYVNMQYHW